MTIQKSPSSYFHSLSLASPFWHLFHTAMRFLEQFSWMVLVLSWKCSVLSLSRSKYYLKHTFKSCSWWCKYESCCHTIHEAEVIKLFCVDVLTQISAHKILPTADYKLPERKGTPIGFVWWCSSQIQIASRFAQGLIQLYDALWEFIFAQRLSRATPETFSFPCPLFPQTSYAV